MRSGGYTVQHSLTPEAANVVKQAVSLARRRGHAQVTPLHVASAMLASSAGLLRRACLQSHSHPLQCKALELCFNVALNRLPTSASNPILLGPHPHLPSMSNALVAAFKRAQAHQRRGSIENQQQPILALKVEVEQLVISILDDPSVSRVMREAGFSSTHVKTNVEQVVSLEICSPAPVSVVGGQSKESTAIPLLLGAGVSKLAPMNHHQFMLSPRKSSSYYQVKEDDVISVVDTMINRKRRNIVVVGECPSTGESVVKEVIDRFGKGDVPAEMKYVQFISVPLLTLRNISREDFEEKLGELRSLVKTNLSRGVVLFLGDLKWVSEYWSNYGEQRSNYYSPVEHMVMELSRLSHGTGEINGKLWLMGIATFQSYIKCKTGRPSLESLWDLHPLTVPVGSLSLSLNLDSDLNTQFSSKASVKGSSSSWLLEKAASENHLSCCADCVANFKREARSKACMTLKSESATTPSSLPSWLQQYKDEKRRESNNIIHLQEREEVRDLCKKWNSICSSVHKRPHFLDKAFNLSTPSPSSSTSISSNEKGSSKLHQSTLQTWPVIFDSNKSPKERQFFVSSEATECKVFESNFTACLPVTKPDLLSNPNSSPNSASSSEASGDHMECLHGFKELNPENLKILSNALEKKVPWQREIVPEIASTVLECRSGRLMKTKPRLHTDQKREDSWLFFLGADSEGKEKIARELAQVVFGSQDSFIAIGLSSFSSSTRADSTEEVISNKRARDEHGRSYLQRFADAVRDNPSRVFFMEDVDQADYLSQKGIKKAIENGGFTLPEDDDDFVSSKDAIVIFSCDSFSSVSSRASSPLSREHKNGDRENGRNIAEEEKKPRASVLDLNVATEADQDEDEDEDEDSVCDAGILESVDKKVIFKIQVL